MERRKFLQCAAITGCSLLFEGGLNTLLSAQKVPEKADIVVARGVGKSPASITKAAIDDGPIKNLSHGVIWFNKAQHVMGQVA